MITTSTNSDIVGGCALKVGLRSIGREEVEEEDNGTINHPSLSVI